MGLVFLLKYMFIEYNFYTIIFNYSRQNSKKYIDKDKQAIEVYLQWGSLIIEYDVCNKWG